MDIFNEIPAWNNKPSLPREVKRRGYVYLIWSPKWRLFKIGRTNNLKRRVWQIQSDRHFEKISLLYAFEVEDQYQAEKRFHEKFAKLRICGEWFDLSINDIQGFLLQAQVHEMQTHVLSMYLRDEPATDDDCLLKPICIDTPLGQAISEWHYREREA